MTELQIYGWAMFVVYALIVIGVSLYARKKFSGLVGYITAPRTYGPFIIGLALVATACSAAATLGNPGLVHSFGWAGLWYPIGYGGVVIAWAVAAFKLSRVCANAGAKSLPDFVGIRFKSDFIRVVASLATLMGVYYLAGQFAGGAWVFDHILGIDYSTGVILMGLIMVLYVIFGGTHAEILNSAIQGAIMVAMAATVIITVIFSIGGQAELNAIAVSQNPSLGWDHAFADPMFGPFTGPAIAIALTLFAFSPQLTKIWFCIRSEKEIPKALLIAFGFVFIMGMLILYGGLGARAIFPDIHPDTSVLMIIIEYLPTSVVAIAGVGILAAIMSTTAGLFLVSAVAISNDIYKDVIRPRFISKNDDEGLEKRTVLFTRILIVVFGVIGIVIAIDPPPYLTSLLWVGIGAIAAAISPVIVLGSLWRGVSKLAAEVGAVLGLITHIVCYYVLGGWMGIEMFEVSWAGTGVGIILNFIVLVVISFLTKPLPDEYLDKLYASWD